MQRFYVSYPLTIDLTLTDTDIIHQITRVMRSQIGDFVILFDGDGSETTYEIMSISKKSIWLRGKDRRFPQSEGLRDITLYQALPNKIEKIEYILQKWVEVGISKFIFFRAEYSQKLLLSENKKLRLTTIAREAVEQCGWVHMPEIYFFDTINISEGTPTNITLDTTGKVIKVSEILLSDHLSIWIGPEGWWSEKEREKMSDSGFLFVRLWERILRTETAGIVSAFALLHA